MINFAPKFCAEGKKEILEILDPILPEDYDILLIEFDMIKRSNINSEVQLTLKWRVNMKSKDDIDGFICKLGSKSGTTCNKFKGDRSGKGTKIIASGNILLCDTVGRMSRLRQ